MLRNKRRYVILGGVGALVLLLGGVGIAHAQQPQQPVENQLFFRRGPSAGRGALAGQAFNGPIERGPLHGGPVRGLVTVTAEVTGLSEEEVVAALRDGQTIAEIAEAEGADPQDILDAAIAEAETRLQEAVSDGRLTEEQMEEVLDRLVEELPERLEQPWEPGGPMSGAFGQFGEGFWTSYDAVAEILGLAPEELFAELHDGKTLAEIAEEQGVEMAEIRKALEEARVEARKQAIEQAVEDGRMSREHADWLSEGLEEGFLPRGRDAGLGRGSGPGRGGCGGGRGW